jgi:hypothetical protein
VLSSSFVLIDERPRTNKYEAHDGVLIARAITAANERCCAVFLLRI